MDNTQRFTYATLDELIDAISSAGLDLPVSDDLSCLARPVPFGRRTVPNRLATQPMEGCDASADGAPGDLTVRKYQRLAAGGSGLIWFEACAVVESGKANPRQLHLRDGTVDAFGAMVDRARQAAMDSMAHDPVCVLQLTHSGRYSRPHDAPHPIIAHHHPVLDARHGLACDDPLISDEQLDELQDAYVRSAQLAADAGFDAVDIKSCHGYLFSELLGALDRPGRYGGCYENRTRMLRETVGKVHQAVGDRIEVTCRLNAYDGAEYGGGWGASEDDPARPDLTEPIRLVGQLARAGAGAINITVGNPYFNPHVNRPAERMIVDWPAPPERPLTGVARMVHVAREIQQACPEVPVVGSGWSWFRHYMPHLASGAVQQRWVQIVGLGRGAIAYPDFARDVLTKGQMDPKKVCIACSKCTQIMRDGGTSGCAVRDAEIYGPIYHAGRSGS